MTGATETTLSEMVESLTGYDELAIEKHFGAPISDLMNSKPTTGIRGLIFVHKTRENFSAVDAKKQAMELPMRGAMDYFASDEQEPLPEEPVTEQGKDSEPFGSEPANSQPSAY